MWINLVPKINKIFGKKFKQVPGQCYNDKVTEEQDL